jgi:hypothetical protein
MKATSAVAIGPAGAASRPADVHERVSTSETWLTHFRRNQQRDWAIPWEPTVPLPVALRAQIAASIAEFQRGESSSAGSYLAQSARFAGRTGDPAFHAASVLFVREENGHAALLLRFMQRAEIAPRRSTFGDRVFRWLRSCADLGWTSRVLIVAELIAQEYYPCLRSATTDPALVRICDKVICDEEAHIRFQVERIVRVEAAVAAPWLAVRDALQTALMLGTACVVYAGHHGVLSCGLTWGEFTSRVLVRNRRAIETMRALRAGSSFGMGQP